MMRYKETEVPRPTFYGKIAVSSENAEIIGTYKSCCTYMFNVNDMDAIMCCNGCRNVCIKTGRRDQEITIDIDPCLAYKLNNDIDLYNKLVIKQSIFIVFNSFYSPFNVCVNRDENVITHQYIYECYMKC